MALCMTVRAEDLIKILLPTGEEIFVNVGPKEGSPKQFRVRIHAQKNIKIARNEGAYESELNET